MLCGCVLLNKYQHRQWAEHLVRASGERGNGLNGLPLGLAWMQSKTLDMYNLFFSCFQFSRMPRPKEIRIPMNTAGWQAERVGSVMVFVILSVALGWACRTQCASLIMLLQPFRWEASAVFQGRKTSEPLTGSDTTGWEMRAWCGQPPSGLNWVPSLYSWNGRSSRWWSRVFPKVTRQAHTFECQSHPLALAPPPLHNDQWKAKPLAIIGAAGQQEGQRNQEFEFGVLCGYPRARSGCWYSLMNPLCAMNYWVERCWAGWFFDWEGNSDWAPLSPQSSHMPFSRNWILRDFSASGSQGDRVWKDVTKCYQALGASGALLPIQRLKETSIVRASQGAKRESRSLEPLKVSCANNCPENRKNDVISGISGLQIPPIPDRIIPARHSDVKFVLTLFCFLQGCQLHPKQAYIYLGREERDSTAR